MAKAILNGRQIFGNVHLGEGGDVANPNIADVYDPTQTYNTGDRRIYNDVLYVCNDDNVTGAWDSTKWDSATIDEIISALTAADIPYSAGVSVADKLDNVPTFDTLTTSDNNKLLGVSVSGDDISVGAVSYMPTMGGRSTTPTSDLTGSLNTPNTLFTDNITINSKSIVYFQYRAIMKTSSYTGRLTLVIDNVEVANVDMDLTSWMQIIGNYTTLLNEGSHSVSLKLTSTNAGSTATIKAWNTYGYTFIATPTM